MPTGKLTSSKNITEHVKLIQGQVVKSLQDPESRQLAVKIVSSKVEWRKVGNDPQQYPYIKAWGQLFKMRPDLNTACPPRVDECEIAAVWDFLILNCRYVFDITDVDTFVTLQWTLDAGGGDCFPTGTQLLRSDGTFCSVDDVQIGQKIWGRDRWSEVVNKWFKGELPVTVVELNNGDKLRLTEGHKVYARVGDKFERITVSELQEGMELLQPERIDRPLEGGSGLLSLGVGSAPFVVFGAENTLYWRTCLRMAGVSCTHQFLNERHTLHPSARPLRVTHVRRNVETQPCYDIATDDHYVYLPEADCTVSNCDDATIAFAALLKAIGFQVRARVISTQDDPGTWSHIYPLVGIPKDNPQHWVPLDITVTDSVPGWEYPHIASYHDYAL